MLKGLPNLGAKTLQRLEELGIHDRETLEQVGPAGVYRALCAKAGVRLPVCYHLYAFEGALRGVDWRTLTQEDKQRLRAEAGVD